jgi:hypothetical protein
MHGGNNNCPSTLSQAPTSSTKTKTKTSQKTTSRTKTKTKSSVPKNCPSTVGRRRRQLLLFHFNYVSRREASARLPRRQRPVFSTSAIPLVPFCSLRLSSSLSTVHVLALQASAPVRVSLQLSFVGAAGWRHPHEGCLGGLRFVLVWTSCRDYCFSSSSSLFSVEVIFPPPSPLSS